MLLPMFGIGGSEILVILVVALLFLGPDKLPDAAKTISKGIRDLKKQSRALQQTIENDEKIGGAIRDLKSALRGEEAPRPRIQPAPKPAEVEAAADEPVAAIEEAKPSLTLPATAGEADGDAGEDHDEDIGSLIKPASGTVSKSDVQPAGDEPKQKHG